MNNCKYFTLGANHWNLINFAEVGASRRYSGVDTRLQTGSPSTQYGDSSHIWRTTFDGLFRLIRCPNHPMIWRWRQSCTQRFESRRVEKRHDECREDRRWRGRARDGGRQWSRWEWYLHSEHCCRDVLMS